MSKALLIDRVADRLGTSKAEANKAIDTVAEEIGKLVADTGAPVRLTGLGTFNLKHKAARPGRNPATGEPIEIAARDVITFKSSRKG